MIPHGASKSRLATEGGRPTYQFNAPVTFVVPDGDVAGAIHRQMRSEGRV